MASQTFRGGGWDESSDYDSPKSVDGEWMDTPCPSQEMEIRSLASSGEGYAEMVAGRLVDGEKVRCLLQTKPGSLPRTTLRLEGIGRPKD